MIKKVLIPSDSALFKTKLLVTKRAKRILIYKDGSSKVEIWNARKFTSDSDLIGNILSQLWHRGDRDDIVEAIYEVEESYNINCHDGFDREDLENSFSSKVYICYKKGWSSFIPVDEHVVGYEIQNDSITISYGVGFFHGKTIVKKIPQKEYRELIAILEKAYAIDTLGKSDTLIETVHGPICTYDYEYRDRFAQNCGALINDDMLSGRYHDLINRLT